MKSIQDLREQRNALQSKARKLMDDSPGASFTSARAAEVDKILAEIDDIDREIMAIQKAIDGRAEQFFGAQMQASGIEWRDTETGQIIPVAYANKGNIQAQLEGAFPARNDTSQPKASMGEFLRGVAGLRTTESVRNALSVGTDSAGGFSMPTYLQLPMIAALAPQSALLTAGAGVSILTDGSKNYRIAAVNTIPTAAWRNESAALADSAPVFRGVDLTPRSLSFQFKTSRELLLDSANLEQALYLAISQAFAKELDRAGLRGSGSAPEICGILNTSGIQAVTNGTNGASLATTAYANLIAALQAILAANGPSPTAAIMSPRSLTTLAGLLDTTNQPRRTPQILEPWKMLSTSQIPNNLTVGSSTDCSEIYVGDFSTLVYFIREGVSIQPLRELHAGTGEIGFACHTRVDVGMLYPAALGVVTGVRA